MILSRCPFLLNHYKLAGLGFDYLLGSKSRIYVYTAKYSNDDSTKTLKAAAVGLEHNF
jgi:hypothetical protein